jgi:toxin ParE1/3/4
VKPVIIHREARAELDEAAAFYEQQEYGLGASLLAEVEQALRLVGEHPSAWPPYRATTFRHIVLQRFPYREFHDAIWVTAIAHGKRRPGYWRRRRRE